MKNLLLALIFLTIGVLLSQLFNQTSNSAVTETELESLRREIAYLKEQLEDQQTAYDLLQARVQNINKGTPAVAQADDTEQSMQEESITTTTDNEIIPSDQNDQKVLAQLGLSQRELQQVQQEIDAIRLAQLDLRNRAIRGDWFGTERYYKALRQETNENNIYRHQLGDDRYDQYLYLSGTPNRVGVRSVMQGSVAEQIGVKAGDIILSYAEQRVFDWSELSRATTKGTPGEQVRLELMRDNEIINVYAPRGPLGVSLKALTIEP